MKLPYLNRCLVLVGFLVVAYLIRNAELSPHVASSNVPTNVHFESPVIFKHDCLAAPRLFTVKLFNPTDYQFTNLVVKSSCGCVALKNTPNRLPPKTVVDIPFEAQVDGCLAVNIDATGVCSGANFRTDAVLHVWSQPMNQIKVEPSLLNLGDINSTNMRAWRIEVLGEQSLVSQLTWESSNPDISIKPVNSETFDFGGITLSKTFFAVSINNQHLNPGYGNVCFYLDHKRLASAIPIVWESKVSIPPAVPTNIYLGLMKVGQSKSFEITVAVSSPIYFEYDKEQIYYDKVKKTSSGSTYTFGFTSKSTGVNATNVIIKDSAS